MYNVQLSPIISSSKSSFVHYIIFIRTQHTLVHTSLDIKNASDIVSHCYGDAELVNEDGELEMAYATQCELNKFVVIVYVILLPTWIQLNYCWIGAFKFISVTLILYLSCLLIYFIQHIQRRFSYILYMAARKLDKFIPQVLLLLRRTLNYLSFTLRPTLPCC